MAERYDVLVLGASPAGLVAATVAAKAGLRVALMERPLNWPGVKLLSLPAFADALGDTAKDASFMRRITRLRRLMTHGRDWAATECGKADAKSADLVSVEMDDFLSLLGKQAQDAGVNRRAGFVKLIRDDSGRVLGCQTDDKTDIFALITVVADGNDSVSAEELSPRPEHVASELSTQVEETWRHAEGELSRRLNQPEDQGMAIVIAGDVLAGMPVSKAWVYPGSNTLSVGLVYLNEIAQEAHFNADKAIDRITLHPALEYLFKDADKGERTRFSRPLGGPGHLRQLFGPGWMIAGSAAGLYDPRHPYELRMEITSGKCAGDACVHAASIHDGSKLTLGLYKRMLLDSYVMDDLKGAADENARRLKNHDLDGYHPGLFVRRMGLDLVAGIEPRGNRRDELQAEIAKERTMWDLITAGAGPIRVFD